MSNESGQFPTPAFYEPAPEVDTASTVAELAAAQALYAALTDPGMEEFLGWVDDQRAAATEALIVASSLDRVNKLQGKVRFAEEILTLHDSLAAEIRALQSVLEGGTDE